MIHLLKQLFGNSFPTINAAQAQEKISGKQPPLVLDVRQPYEYREGHIAGAKLVPLNELAGRMTKLPRNRLLIVVCQSGSRSRHAARILTGEGFEVENLRGGMIAWQWAGFPIE